MWAPLSPPLAPPAVPLSGSHSPFCSRRGGDIHAAVARQAWHRWHYVFRRYIYNGRGPALSYPWPLFRPSRPPRVHPSGSHALLCGMRGTRRYPVCVCVAGVAHMAPGFLVARLGAVDVAAAAALTSTCLLWFTVTTDVTHVRLAWSCPLLWPPLAPSRL